jgi:flavin reductase (DIM6/NTAB) family NADH-FMN oxidoreductase RutF
LDEERRRLYRRALGAFATGVAVVTVAEGERAMALTVNSFTSVSLDPPLVLWSLGDASDRGVWFREAERFVINVLAADDAELAASCALRGHYELPAGRRDDARAGEPAVAGALSRLYCRTRERIPLGDHLVLVGEVVHFDRRDGDGLIYFRSRYGRAASPEEP